MGAGEGVRVGLGVGIGVGVGFGMGVGYGMVKRFRRRSELGLLLCCAGGGLRVWILVWGGSGCWGRGAGVRIWYDMEI